MKKRLDETIVTPAVENLFAGTYPPAEVFHVTLKKGETEATFERGTALAVGSDGKMVILGTEGAVANCVLAEEVTVGTENDETAVAYRTGHFQGNNLIVKEEYAITAADKENFRKVGILLSDAMEI